MFDPVLASGRNPADNRKIHDDWDMANVIRDPQIMFFKPLMKNVDRGLFLWKKTVIHSQSFN
jgi:hypothetical protein